MAFKAFKGKLRDFSLKQLLNLVYQRQKSGALSIKSPSNVAELFFDRGKLMYASLSNKPNTLADLMVQVNKLTQKEADSITASNRFQSDKQLGRALIQANRISQEEMLQALRQNMMDVVHTVFNWEDGTFVFDEQRKSPVNRITIPLSLEKMVVDENSQPKKSAVPQGDSLPSLEVVLRFTEGRGRNLRSINLSIDEWRVISFINPRNTVADIAQHNQMNHDEVRRIVTKLIKDEVVEIAKDRSTSRATSPHPVRAVTTKPKPIIQAKPDIKPKPNFASPKIEKGIISRLIARIRGL